MKVLITGSSGQVGTCLVEQLQAYSDIEILALDRYDLDITSQYDVNKVTQKFKPNIIINAAAYTAVDKAEREIELSHAVNHDGPLYLANAAEKIGAALLHISTDYVFAGNKEGIYSEKDKVEPQGVYGKSKLAGEHAVITACSRSIILRTAWVFGEHGSNFAKTILKLARERNELNIVADQFGGPTYSGDIARALIIIARNIISEGKNFNSDKYGIYHFSGLPHTSWYGFAKIIIDKAFEQNILKNDIILNGIKSKDYPTPAKRPINSKLNTQKITKTFGIEASDWQCALNQLSDY